MDYRADCTRCQGLCCVSLPFDRSEAFAFDKPADVPCRHLNRSHRCGIFAELELLGCSGCARYDCYGAGQRVTEELFPNRSWRENPELARSMFEAFRRLRRLHELLALLDAAARFTPESAQERERQRLLDALDSLAGWTSEGLAACDVGAAEREVMKFLRSLRPLAASTTAADFGRTRSRSARVATRHERSR